MKAFRVVALIVSLSVMLVFSTPGHAVSKEIVQLQTQVQNLLDQMGLMQQSFNERMGVMRSLVEQQTDTVNKVNASLHTLQESVAKSKEDQGARADQISGQIQALNDSMDELKAKVAKLSTQLDQLNQAAQNLAQPAPAAAPPQPPLPADTMYNNALRDYNAGKYDLAAQEFAEYLKFYPTTDLAGNSQFYLADINLHQEDYAAAVKGFDVVIDQYPSGTKAAAAHLRKGQALQALGQKEAAIKEFDFVVKRYPRQHEADLARDQLRKLRKPR